MHLEKVLRQVDPNPDKAFHGRLPYPRPATGHALALDAVRARPSTSSLRAEGEAIHPTTLGETSVQIAPHGVHQFDQCDLFRARTGLDLLLAGDGLTHPFVRFVENQTVAAVPACESRSASLPMFESASSQIRCHSGVERTAFAIREDVYAWLARRWGYSSQVT